MNNLFICKTTWEHFVTILCAMKLYNDKGIKSDLIVELADENKLYWDELISLDCFRSYEQYNLIQNRVVKFILFKYRVNYSLCKKIKKYLIEDYNINVFVDQSVISQTFIKNRKYIDLYEHGNGNYLVGAFPNYPFLKKMLGVTAGYGRCDYVRNVFLQYPEKSPEDIKHKVKELNISDLFNNLNYEQKKQIYSVFKIPEKIEQDGILILTQPLSEDGFMSECKKIEIYRNMILKESGMVFIKPHPRDSTDYSKMLLNNVRVLSKSFPIEILNFMNVKFSKALTVCSGSIYNFSYPIDVEIQGTELYPELIKPLGFIKEMKLKKENYKSIEYV